MITVTSSNPVVIPCSIGSESHSAEAQTTLNPPRLVSLPHISCRNERVDIDGSWLSSRFSHRTTRLLLERFAVIPSLLSEDWLDACLSLNKDPQQRYPLA